MNLSQRILEGILRGSIPWVIREVLKNQLHNSLQTCAFRNADYVIARGICEVPYPSMQKANEMRLADSRSPSNRHQVGPRWDVRGHEELDQLFLIGRYLSFAVDHTVGKWRRLMDREQYSVSRAFCFRFDALIYVLQRRPVFR